MVRGRREDDPVLTMTNENPPNENEPDRRAARTPRTSRPASRPASRPPSSRRPQAPGPRRLYRSRDDRVIGGVCGGIAKYFDIDPVLVRVGAVALVFLGGAGILAYLAAVLLIPNEGEAGQPPEAPKRGLAIAGVVLLVVAICVVLPFQGGWGPNWGLVPLGFLALAGLLVWRLASGQRPEGDARAVLRAMALGLALIAVCFVLAIAGAWAAAAGGNGVVAGHRHRGRRRPDRRRLLRLLGALAHPARAGPRAARRRRRRRRPRRQRRHRRGHVPPGQRRRGARLLSPGRRAPGRRPARRAPDCQVITACKIRLGVGGAELLVPPGVCVSTNSHVGIGGTLGLQPRRRRHRHRLDRRAQRARGHAAGRGRRRHRDRRPDRPSQRARALGRRAGQQGVRMNGRRPDLPVLRRRLRARRPRRRAHGRRARRDPPQLRGLRSARVLPASATSCWPPGSPAATDGARRLA